MRFLRLFLLMFVLPVFVAVTPARAGEEQRVVERARLMLEEFLDDPQFESMRVYVRNAYGVIIVPQLLEGGFIVGGKYGKGVLLVRDVQTGEWSPPVFVRVIGGSIGLQLGGQTVDIVMTLMNEQAVRKVLTSNFKIGADAKAAVGPIGAGVGTGTTLNFGEDVYYFSKNMGLFAGLSLDGTAIVPDEDANAAYYGQAVTVSAIVSGAVGNPGADELRRLLSTF